MNESLIILDKTIIDAVAFVRRVEMNETPGESDPVAEKILEISRQPYAKCCCVFNTILGNPRISSMEFAVTIPMIVTRFPSMAKWLSHSSVVPDFVTQNMIFVNTLRFNTPIGIFPDTWVDSDEFNIANVDDTLMRKFFHASYKKFAEHVRDYSMPNISMWCLSWVLEQVDFVPDEIDNTSVMFGYLITKFVDFSRPEEEFHTLTKKINMIFDYVYRKTVCTYPAVCVPCLSEDVLAAALAYEDGQLARVDVCEWMLRTKVRPMFRQLFLLTLINRGTSLESPKTMVWSAKQAGFGKDKLKTFVDEKHHTAIDEHWDVVPEIASDDGSKFAAKHIEK